MSENYCELCGDNVDKGQTICGNCVYRLSYWEWYAFEKFLDCHVQISNNKKPPENRCCICRGNVINPFLHFNGKHYCNKCRNTYCIKYESKTRSIFDELTKMIYGKSYYGCQQITGETWND